ncbi:MAG: M48 family metallopeptidase [Cyclobacteriaceae bacterium]|nr:M48 family metallopeptidase [Cyclobacteriaceae bacterium]
MEHRIQFGSKEIVYQLTYSKRKSLGITITPALHVLVTAPEGASVERIEAIVRKRAPWIISQENFFLSFHPKTPARKYVGGESHLYLGRQYILRINEGKKNDIHRKRNTIEVTVKSRAQVKKVLLNWYRLQAKEKFGELAEPWIEEFRQYRVKPTGIYLQNMPTRWGSCTPNGKIILNPELIKAPKRCIEYVIIHELCHLVHHDHTQKFFDLQKKVMPDWVRWKNKLEKLLA